jgi:Response regulators consisting of a CheY-like receiver domain and a winged-helix DNA-binding domain
VLDDKLAAFDCGADDYLVKPFALREVEARLKALVARRRGRVVSRKLVHGGIEFDPANLAVSVDGRPVHLSRKCLRLLEMMMTAPNRVYSRAELEQELWGDEHPQSDSLRSHMHMLRRALTDARGLSPIETVHGVGYRFAAADARQA